MAKFTHVLPGEFRQAELRRHLVASKQLPFGTMLALVKARQCHCGSLHCPLCGFIKFNNRVSRIENNPNLVSGYLSGRRT